MEFTGERFLPEELGDIALEHKHRYLLAAIYAQGKDVLDIASGEGYGSALLANVAKSVVGVDISSETVAHAQRKYIAHNLRYCQGSAAAIPLPDASVDLVVSFETIEHHDQHEEMFREIKRVLRPSGILYISSPDHYEYSVVPNYNNEYHIKELSYKEFDTLLGKYFAQHKMAGQRLVYGSAIVTEKETADFIAWDANTPIQSHAAGLPHAVYLLALASDGELPQTFSSLLETRIEDSDPYRFLCEADEDLKNKFHLLEEQYHILEGGHRTLENKHADLEDQYHIIEDGYKNLESEVLKTRQRFQKIKGGFRRIFSFISLIFKQFMRFIDCLANYISPALLPLKKALAKKKNVHQTSAAANQTPFVNVVQERIAAYKAGEHLSAAPIKDIRIYVAAAGNHFFYEIAQLIQGGFTDLGIHSSVIVADTLEDYENAANADADLHWVVAPHEFFHFFPQAANWPHPKGKKWILNTEQEHTSWFAGAKAYFNWADLVLDMDLDLAEHHAREGFRSEHLPLGFSTGCDIFNGTETIPLTDATNGIPERIRNWTQPGNPLDTPLHDRPLDYCFFGTSTDRRMNFFARNASVFAGLEGYLRLQPLSGPLRADGNAVLFTKATSSIIGRSKISLNIHQSNHCYFEWHRIILQGIWQGALVLSEPCTPAWPFRPNIDYVSVDLDTIADALEYLLLSDEGKKFAERVRHHAYTTLVEQCRMGTRLDELLRLYGTAWSA